VKLLAEQRASKVRLEGVTLRKKLGQLGAASQLGQRKTH